MSRLHRLVIKDVSTVTVEIDPQAGAFYLRFRRGKVAKTVAEDRHETILARDFDAKGELLGVEVVGGRLLRLGAVLKAAGVKVLNLQDVQFKTVPA
jgi:uncharacterized protein YuzE